MIDANPLYTNGTIRTFTGAYFDVFDPDPELICIEDIAHSLSHQPRFGGHLPVPYTVAQHCIMAAASQSNERLKLATLLHDASEAYLLDMPKPIKDKMPDYLRIEDGVMSVIAKKYGFEYPLHADIKKVDKEMLEWEHDIFVIKRDWELLKILSPSEAKAAFLSRYDMYFREHSKIMGFTGFGGATPKR